jgi:hypothetical protein
VTFPVNVMARGMAQPGRLTYGLAGNSSYSHLFGALFGRLSGGEMLHVPTSVACHGAGFIAVMHFWCLAY